MPGQNQKSRNQELYRVLELMSYWRSRRDEAEKMVKSLLDEERIIRHRMLK